MPPCKYLILAKDDLILFNCQQQRLYSPRVAVIDRGSTNTHPAEKRTAAISPVSEPGVMLLDPLWAFLQPTAEEGLRTLASYLLLTAFSMFIVLFPTYCHSNLILPEVKHQQELSRGGRSYKVQMQGALQPGHCARLCHCWHLTILLDFPPLAWQVTSLLPPSHFLHHVTGGALVEPKQFVTTYQMFTLLWTTVSSPPCLRNLMGKFYLSCYVLFLKEIQMITGRLGALA